MDTLFSHHLNLDMIVHPLAGCRRERFLGAKRQFWLMRAHQSHGFRWLFGDFWPVLRRKSSPTVPLRQAASVGKTAQEAADALAGLLNEIKMPTVDVIGISAAGPTALAFVQQHSSKLRKLATQAESFRRSLLRRMVR